jgi:hypothetical protein
MSITPSTKRTSPLGTKFALISAVSLGLVGGPVALAVPADASTSLRGCTVNPLKPTDERNNKADFRIRVDCNGNKTVEVRQRRFEDNRGARRNDDFLGRDTFKRSFDRRDDRITIHSIDRVDADRGRDRVYHEVSFRVKNNNGNWSDWTRWEKSEVATIN